MCALMNVHAIQPEILVVLPQTTFSTLFADSNLAVWYSIAAHAGKNLADFNLVVERPTAKPPNFPAI